MTCRIFAVDDQWQIQNSPTAVVESSPKAGVILATAVEFFVSRISGTEKSLSLLFDPGEKVHLLQIEVLSNAKFCEVYTQDDLGSSSYQATCRGEVNEASLFSHSYFGRKTSFSKLQLKFLSLKNDPNQLSIMELKVIFAKPSLISSGSQLPEPGEYESAAQIPGGFPATGMSPQTMMAMNQMRSDLLRDISNIVEEKMQLFVSHLYSVEGRLRVLEGQNKQILEALQCGDRRGAVNKDSPLSTLPNGISADQEREGCNPDGEKTREGDGRAVKGLSAVDFTSDCGEEVLVLENADEDDVSAELKTDMRQLLSLLRSEGVGNSSKST